MCLACDGKCETVKDLAIHCWENHRQEFFKAFEHKKDINLNNLNVSKDVTVKTI